MIHRLLSVRSLLVTVALLVTGLGSVLLLAACDGATTPPSVQSISVVPDAATVHDLGATQQFDAVARDQDGNEMSDVSLEWDSTPDSVVAVDGEGTATAQGNGSAIIEVRASGQRVTARMMVRAGELRWTEIRAGLIHSCGVTTHGTLACWGDNVHGQLGNDHRRGAFFVEPVTVEAPLLYFKHVTAGGGHTCAIAQDNAAYCWGASSFGEGGYGEENTSVQVSPVEVSGGLSFAQLTTGGNHTCGVTPDGEAYCWGKNKDGELGDGSTTDRSTPVEVAAEITFSQLNAVSGAGSNFPHTCGVASDGTAYCWGNNRFGQLGDGSTSNRNEPTAVEADVPFAEVAAGKGHTCGITTDGTAYCWGQNDGGALGDGTTEDRRLPVEVEGGTPSVRSQRATTTRAA